MPAGERDAEPRAVLADGDLRRQVRRGDFARLQPFLAEELRTGANQRVLRPAEGGQAGENRLGRWYMPKE